MWAPSGSVRLLDACTTSRLDRPSESLDGRSVLIATRDPFAAALAIIELDGLAGRLVLAPPGTSVEQLRAVAARARIEAVVTDGDELDLGVPLRLRWTGVVTRPAVPESARRATEWILLTSGTAAASKMVRHTFRTLTAAIDPAATPASDVVWGTFYDIRRYGGLQAFLRALVGGGSLVLGGAGETVGAYLDRLAEHGATHVSGTPSHWRRVLMSPNASAIAPRSVRLSGEIADQSILDALRARYPRARIVHAFASTEAGLGFEVDDGGAGFPDRLLGAEGQVAVRVDGGSLRLRSAGNALGYLDDDAPALADADGFVDTGDMVACRAGRWFFLGRRTGVINVGGLKVYPEEVEAAINRHPSVRMSRVRSRRSPITGSLIAAEVVLDGDAANDCTREIVEICRGLLPAHMIPATIRVVPSLEIADAGKLARHA
jgi:acyl-coenzyme A synthetase/AMP-(fatty) acid ligase